MEKRTSENWFPCVDSQGGLLPADFLRRLAAINKDEELGVSPEQYGVPESRLTDAISQAWDRARSAWKAFQDALSELPESDPAIQATRQRWLLPVFKILDYGPLQPESAEEIDGKLYPVSHRWNRIFPVHLVGCRQDLDRRPEGGGWKPHSLMQEYLNASDSARWGFVSNGLRLRLLRDSARVSRQSYVEFDLEGIFNTGAYADFSLMWLICHQSRIAGTQEECWLEKWFEETKRLGARALDTLRDGVQGAIVRLGTGYLRHPGNLELRRRLRDGELDRQDYFRQLLRMTYRLLFLFVAEDREQLHRQDTSEKAKQLYDQYYSTRRFRRMARRYRTLGRHGDLGVALNWLFSRMETEGIPEFGIDPPGGFLWDAQATPDLGGAAITNADLLWAINSLSWIEEDRIMRPVDFRNLGSEELGSIFESLLELHPVLDIDSKTFDLRTAAGNDRKSTGSYYTPDSLIQSLLDSALEPVLKQAMKAPNPVSALERIKVCDPACGSGHFLVAAAHRIAKRLSVARASQDNALHSQGDHEPGPHEIRSALRYAINNCLYGVDVNEMAVELCKVALWMEAQMPGASLVFLEDRIKCGNSLLGATPALLDQPLPDAAFDPLEGDEPDVCKKLRKINKDECSGEDLFTHSRRVELGAKQKMVRAGEDDGSLRRQHELGKKYATFRNSPEFKSSVAEADSWMTAFIATKKAEASTYASAFVQPKTTDRVSWAITQSTIRLVAEAGEDGLNAAQREVVEKARKEYKFFNWHLEFSDVFSESEDGMPDPTAGWHGGFDCVLGNPPWERIKLQEKEWFAQRVPEIAEAPNAAARLRLIKALLQDNPAIHAAFSAARRKAEGESALLRNTGRFPLCGRGDVNTYSVFAELMRSLVRPGGRVGCIVPSGLATDDTLKHFFRDLMDSRTLNSFYDFENRNAIFPGVHRSFKFALVTMRKGESRDADLQPAEFAFFLQSVADLEDDERRFTLTADDLKLLNPNTRTSPIFRSRKDAELTKYIYRRVPILWREAEGESPEENPWGLSFKAMFHMSNDSGHFKTRKALEEDGWELTGNVFEKDGKRMLPLYEAKMVHHFDHRWAGYVPTSPARGRVSTKEEEVVSLTDEDKMDPNLVPFPRYWVPEDEVRKRLENRWAHGWLFGWRDICRNTDERTIIAGAVPIAGCGDTFLIAMPSIEMSPRIAAIPAILNSMVCDYLCRQKIGGIHLKYHVFRQIPVLAPVSLDSHTPWSFDSTTAQWVCDRVIELIFTTKDLSAFARDMGYQCSPFQWNRERRAHVRVELDAAFFHLYFGSQEDWIRSASEKLREIFPAPRDVIPHIMDSFPIVKEKDLKEYGHYRTCEAILTEYDRMSVAIATGIPYESTLSPKPGQHADVLSMLQSPVSLSILYSTFVLELFAARPEIDKMTFRNLRALVEDIFTDPKKFLSYHVSPEGEVQRHINAVHDLFQQDSTAKVDEMMRALINADAVIDNGMLARGSRFEESRALYPSADCIAWLVQECLRIEARGEQLVAGEALLNSSSIVGDVDLKAQAQNEQAKSWLIDKLNVKG